MSNLKGHKCVCGKCELKSSKRLLTGPGKKTKFILENETEKSVDKYVVDDCLLRLKGREEKCDYLFDVKKDKIALFIECKGSDVLKAVSQIESTINILKKDLADYILKARIISTKVYSPDMRTEEYKKFREKLKGQVETKNIELKEKI